MKVGVRRQGAAMAVGAMVVVSTGGTNGWREGSSGGGDEWFERW
jgi:hypothetical protein